MMQSFVVLTQQYILSRRKAKQMMRVKILCIGWPVSCISVFVRAVISHHAESRTTKIVTKNIRNAFCTVHDASALATQTKSDTRIPSQKEDYCIVKHQLFIIYIADSVSNGNAIKISCIQIGLDVSNKVTFFNWLAFVCVVQHTVYMYILSNFCRQLRSITYAL